MKFKVLGTLAAITLSASAAQAETRLLVNCFWPARHHVCSEVLPAWLDEVERVTEGRVTGNLPPRSLAPPPEQLSSVESGIADVAVQFNGLIQNRVTGPLVAMQPWVGSNDAAAMSRALWATNQEFFPDEFDTVQLLSQFVISPGQLYSQTDTPINSIEELASRKIWALPGPLSAITTRLGAGVVSTPAVQSNEIISRGVVDGHLGLDAQAVGAFQLMPYTTSNTQFQGAFYTTSFSVFMNQDKWAEISAEDQAAIMEVSGSVLAESFGSTWDTKNRAAEEGYAEASIEVIQADPAFEAALVVASAFVTEGWLAAATEAGIDGAAALDFYKAQLAE
jgi:TRAP-type C4-dicarboxylate transport system substrate-binding protein